MLARIDGTTPDYMARVPHILASHHVSPPSILGNISPPPFQSRSGWPSSTEVLARIDGCFPEWMANMPSTLRYAAKHSAD